MKVRKLVAVTLITSLIASSTAMISGAEVGRAEERIPKTVQIASDSNAFLPENEVVDEAIEDDIALLVATSSDATYVSTEEELREAVGKSGTVVVDGTIELSQPLYIRGGVELALKDGTITFPGKTVQNLITISNAQVTLSNIKIDVTGMDWDKLTDVYDALWIQKDARVIMEEGTILMTDDPEGSLNSERKTGIWVDGKLEMNNASVTGFSSGGVAVRRDATFILNEGEITHNYEGISNNGYTEINGGLISNNINNGVLNRGKLEMNDGEISHNWSGILNLDIDGNTGGKLAPEAVVSGGTIFGHEECAIANKYTGTIIVKDGADIIGVVEPTNVYRSKTTATEPKLSPVVSNSDNGTLKLEGGTITSHNKNQIALLNDKAGKLVMTGGEIIAAGTAVKNENPSVGDVKLLRGKISLTNDEGIAIDNQGYMEATGDMEIEASNQYLIAVSHEPALGGKISPSTQMAKVGDEIDITVTPNSGYKIAELTVDGVKQDVVSSHKLTVSGNHSIIAKFEKKPSSGGSSGSGGGGGSSSGSRKVSSDEEPSISETPGSWIQNETGWKFTQPDGTAYVNTWIRKNNQWYWVGADSYMVQGWNLINGAWYYLTPVSGEMKTGWLDDNGIWYYLDKDGKKAVNITTPDGYKVDGNGVWIK